MAGKNGRMRRKSQLWQLRIERSPDLGKPTPLQTAVDILTEHLTSGQFDFQRSQGINYGHYDGTPLTAFPQSRILKPSGLLLLTTSPMRVPKFNVKAFATDRLEEWTSLPGIALRFGILIPLGLYQQHAKTHWKIFGNHPELGDIYDQDILLSENMAMKWGQRNFYYHLAVLIPSIFVLAPVNIIFAIPDIVLLAYLCITASYQGNQFPQTEKACADPASLPNIAFLQAAAHLGLSTDVQGACKDFAQQRNLVVVLCALIASMVFFNIWHCLLVCVSLAKQVNSSRSSHSQLPIWSALLPTMMLPFRDVGVLCFWIFCYVPGLTFRRLPAAVQARILFAVRYSVKSIQAKSRRKTSAQGARDAPAVTRILATREKTVVTPLADFLGIYDVLVMIASHLHYIDITNLSLVSKDICQTLLSAPDGALRKYTCEPYSRERCWACSNQCCNGCSCRRSLEETHSFYDHVFHCVPLCSACYLRTLRKPRVIGLPAIGTRRCGCERPVTGNNFHQQTLCRTCNQLPEAELIQEEMRRWRSGIRCPDATVGGVKRRVDLGCCFWCKNVVGKGPRWWVCEMCEKECWSGMHRR